MSRRSRRQAVQPPSAEDSWRMIEGENDSFDTSIVPVSQGSSFVAPRSSGSTVPSEPSGLGVNHRDNNESFGPSSSPPSSRHAFRGLPSQGQVSLGSQDSIRDFQTFQDDEDVILRQPFRPSVRSAHSSKSSSFKVPEPQLKMPRIDHLEDDGLKRRARYRDARVAPKRRSREEGSGQEDVSESFAGVFFNFTLTTLFWILDLLAITLRLVQKPIAILLALYFCVGAIIFSSNLLTQSLSISLSPLCRLPGASLLPIPFCPPAFSDSGSSPPFAIRDEAATIVDFEPLVNAQSRFEGVLEQSLETAFLPIELARSRAALNDLRTLYQASTVPSRREIDFELSQYVMLSRDVGWKITQFNTHTDGAVRYILHINRWASRYLSTVDQSLPSPEQMAVQAPSLLDAVASWWPFRPFTPIADYRIEHKAIVEQYIALAARTILQIKDLLLEAQIILRDLSTAETHLQVIHRLTHESSSSTSASRDAVLSKLWTRLGGNRDAMKTLNQQLRLLDDTRRQRLSAVQVITGLVVELQQIQASLEYLQMQMSAPQLTVVDAPPLRSDNSRGVNNDNHILGIDEIELFPIPLSVHISVIDDGIARLETAKARIDEKGRDALQKALEKAGMENVQAIEQVNRW